jgi:4-amino-4-deoxy-L-arabinose transferase-like glycosyltransferase
MALGAFEPNLIAHSSLVTTDLGATLFMFLAVYLFWEYVTRPSWWLLVGTGGAAGLALVSKYSAVLIIGMVGLLAAGEILIGDRVAMPAAVGGRRTKAATARAREA